MRFGKRLTAFILITLSLSACKEDLLPSGEDKRPDVVAGSIGYLPTQKIADFQLNNTLGQSISLYDYLNVDGTNTNANDAVVIYFTMWCSICLAHTDSIAGVVKPAYDQHNIKYLLIDYVSGTVSVSRSAELENINASYGMEVLVDVNNQVQQQLHGGMGIVVVVDSQGIIHMNQNYNSVKVMDTLTEIVGP